MIRRVRTRPEVADARRIVIKVGSSSLTGADGRLDAGRVAQLAELISAKHRAGARIVLVTSGAIAAALGVEVTTLLYGPPWGRWGSVADHGIWRRNRRPPPSARAS